MKSTISLTLLCCSLMVAISLTSPAEASAGVAENTGCRVTSANGADATIVRTGAEVHLAKGTVLTLLSSRMQQGYISVSALVSGKSQRLAVQADDTDCVH